MISEKEKRKLQFRFDTMRAEQNSVSKQIPELKKSKKDTSEIVAQMRDISNKIKEISIELSSITEELETKLLNIPNIPYKDVPIGGESENEFVREWGEKKQFDFNPIGHLDLIEKNKLLDLYEKL